MATMIYGESYLGKVMVQPVSKSGDITMYLWPMRCLKSRMGGPTFGVDVRGVEMIRFDPHGPRGHWHKGGYDKLGAGGSHVEFPDGLVDSDAQITWALEQIRDQGQEMLEAAGYPEDAGKLDPEMLKSTSEAILAHLESEGDVRSRAIDLDLVNA